MLIRWNWDKIPSGHELAIAEELMTAWEFTMNQSLVYATAEHSRELFDNYYEQLRSLNEDIDENKLKRHIAASGNLAWLQELGLEGLTDAAIAGAAANGHEHIVQFLCDNNASCNSDAIFNASTNGHYNVVKYLYEQRKPIDHHALNIAAENGHLAAHYPDQCNLQEAKNLATEIKLPKIADYLESLIEDACSLNSSTQVY